MRGRIALLLSSLACLSACAAPPSGPTVLEVPGPNKTLPQFQADDAGCRNYAQTQVGPVSPSQTAANKALAGAALGTAAGAAAGAAIGAAAGNAGTGAAIGAGSGLALGTVAGAKSGGYEDATLQKIYDASYIQCMAANGNKLEAYPVYAEAAPGFYGYPYSNFDYGPYGYFGGPVFAFGLGGGYGYGWHHGWHGRGGYWPGGWHGGSLWHGGGYPHGGWGGGYHGGRWVK